MPELKSEHGYWITLVAMGLITFVLLIYFWRKGWIFQAADDLTINEEEIPKEDEI